MIGYACAGFGRVFGWIRRSGSGFAWIDFGKTWSTVEHSVKMLRERVGWLEEPGDSKCDAEDAMSCWPNGMGGFQITLMKCS